MAIKAIQTNNQPHADYVQPVDSLIGLSTLQQQIHKGKSWIYKQILLNAFPAPIKLGRSSLWSQNAINEYIESVKAGDK